MKKIMLVLVVFFFLSTFLCLSANSISYMDFLAMWQRAQVSLEMNNPGGHSNIYTDTEITPEDIALRIGWIEGVGYESIIIVEPEDFNWFGPGVIPAIGNGYYNEDGIYVPTDVVSPETNPGDNYTYFQLTLPPDPVNIPPETTFPSIGFYIPDDGL